MLGEYGVAVDAAAVRRAEVRGRRLYDAAATRPRVLAPGEPHPVLGSIAPGEAYFAGMLEGLGCRHPLLEEAVARMVERQQPPSLLWARPMEGAREAVAAVHAFGLRAACVSNSDGRAEHHLVVCGVRDGLEFVVDSQIVGVEKPDPRIFGIALERLGVVPDRALYVGDIRSVDEAGARAAGMHVVIVDEGGDYAPEGTPSIRGTGALAAHLEAHFDLGVRIRTP
jgi:HAD superfamily hydrolase (TIGR01509 family)